MAAMNAHLEQLKLAIKNAWLTLSMLPDPDIRFRRAFGKSWTLPVVQDPNTAYGSTPASWLGTPSAHEISVMEATFEWLAWLRGQDPPDGGELAIKRIAAWSLGAPIWKMAFREHCTERTIHNRIDRGVAKISGKFRGEDVEIEKIEEPELRPERIRGFTPPREPDQSGSAAMPGKVFISGGEHGGVGFFMFRGEKYKSSYDLDDKISGKRR
jgi:hypothetical protein